MTRDHEEALTCAYQLRSLLDQLSTSEVDSGRLADRARRAMDQLDEVIAALEPPLPETAERPEVHQPPAVQTA